MGRKSCKKQQKRRQQQQLPPGDVGPRYGVDEWWPGCGEFGHTVAICPTQYQEEEVEPQPQEEDGWEAFLRSMGVSNYIGPAKIVVQCVSTDEPPLLHVHSVVGKQCTNGICEVYINSNDMIASFPNLGILHVPRRSVAEILEERLVQGWRKENSEGSQLKELTGKPAQGPLTLKGLINKTDRQAGTRPTDFEGVNQ
ncbi:UNVERIFIED_CONTAM: hypothetical protein FKN15_012760 [Acipenser sinensis]